EPDMIVCGEAEDVKAAEEGVAKTKPDMVIVDISLNEGNGIDLVKSIRSRDQELPILVLSMHDESLYAERALRAGANGYIMKQEATENVLVALRRILNREIYVSSRFANKMLQQFVGGNFTLPRHSPVDDLSNRELEVLRL